MTRAFKVTNVDPADETTFARYHAVFVEAATPGRTDPTIWTLPESRAGLLEPNSSTRQEVFVAWEGRTPVGAGDLGLPLVGNTDQIDFDFAVLPTARRRGVGTAMLAHVAERARAEGRTTWSTELSVTAGTERDAPGAGFLAANGLTARNTEFRRQ